MVREAHHLDDVILLNSAVPVAQLQFGEQWPLSILRNDRDCVEENRYLRRIQDRAPFDAALADVGGGYDVEYRILPNAPIAAGEIAMGLGLAHQTSGLSISFNSHPSWCERDLRLLRRRLDEGDDLIDDEVMAANATSLADIEHHRASFYDPEPVTSGVELWACRGELFPCLAFIPRTRAQIEGLLRGEPRLQAIIGKLRGLNGAIEQWGATGAEHPLFTFKVRNESDSRIQRGLVNFHDEAQVTHVFSLHCDFTPGEGRIHFLLESHPTRIALIGHVGGKIGIG